MPNHDASAIANEFLRRAQNSGVNLTNMQLQKLPYIAHGWSLATLGEPLIIQQPQTWPYGPVYQDLYENLKRYGAGPVDALIRENNACPFEDERGDIVSAELNELERNVIDAVWDEYGSFTGGKLSRITHKPGTPWTITMQQNGPYSDISNDCIRKHYEHLLAQNIQADG
ncbi:uncharacterized phage-associated protein-like protein [Acetobacter pasteurianus NBRC 101655]|uniref:Panacea domain-containing protein n=1 Tax=Acetobacter pasteurianus TaxID=438 RepID=UPI00054E4834|nr:type II toxin-antitoxin system antitoxin SocA domain-containing protein [Acetobacter pasteurianus]BAU37863.1 uncharacterized phage-associated protein-like protein [Acetobacter pasteurianus NBRC 101655]